MGPRVDVLSYQKARKKWTCDLLTHTPYLLLAVCLYKKKTVLVNKKKGEHIHLMPDCPVKREVCSWILFSLSSKLSYHLLPHSFIFILIYNLPGTVDCHSLTPQRIIEGASRGYTVRENSLGGAACTGLIDVTQRLG